MSDNLCRCEVMDLKPPENHFFPQLLVPMFLGFRASLGNLQNSLLQQGSSGGTKCPLTENFKKFEPNIEQFGA